LFPDVHKTFTPPIVYCLTHTPTLVATDEGLVQTSDWRVVETYAMNSGLPGKWARWVYGQGPLQVLTMRDDGGVPLAAAVNDTKKDCLSRMF